MVSYFFDSSAVVKRYVAETGSAWVQAITNRSAGNDLILARLTHVEVVAALVRHRPALPPADLALTVAAFELDCRQRRFRFVAVTQLLIARAATLAARYRLRGYDAIQLAGALAGSSRNRVRGLPTPILVCSDRDLNNAARREGLTVDDPNSHP